jgi:hypothetical protein
MSASEREAVEARVTYWRVLELERDPVPGAFDAAHLQEASGS